MRTVEEKTGERAFTFVLRRMAILRGVKRSFVLVSAAFLLAHGQSRAPSVQYRITIDPQDLSGFGVDMKIRNAPDTIRLAFAQHPEYNEFFWKNLTGLSAVSGGRRVALVREDSALWRCVANSPELAIQYRFKIHPPSDPERRSWKIFLSKSGGLLGGVQTFLYLVGYENVFSRVALSVPSGWRIATGLVPTDQLHVYDAWSVNELLDSPILMGQFREWDFVVNNIPHHVVYWPLPNASPFDTVEFAGSTQRIVQAATNIFGRAPYREYWFLLQDGAGDALEHLNSLTLGAKSSGLARDPHAYAAEIAHEFFHTWNLVNIRPREQTAVTYKETTPTPVLWLSEGVTIYYANKLLRQSGLRDSAWFRQQLASTIAAYEQSPGNSRFSPEHTSLTANHPDPAGSGYTGSYYTQGMLIGQLLDIAIRDSTHTEKGLDDVMKAMFEKFSRSKGFTDADLEQTASQICGCNLDPFFRDHICGTIRIDLEPSLRSIGLRADIKRTTAVDSAGNPLPDRRVFAYTQLDDNGHVKILIYGVPTAWWRAGLRTGDDLLAVDGVEIKSADQFRALIAAKNVGDRLAIRYLRDGRQQETTVLLSPYEQVRVELKDLPNPTRHQREMMQRWIAGTL